MEENKLLENQKSDYVASAAKSALGAVPFVGSLLAEVAGTIIPNQRIERIVKFAELLEAKVNKLEQEFIRSQLTNEYFTDLLEEGLRQASRSITDERREYIASIIANSLSTSDINIIESKHLLRILNEVNDIEIIWLRFYLVPTIGGDEEFRNKQKDILERITVFLNSQDDVRSKAAIQESYKEHLAQLGLIEPLYKVDRQTKQLELESVSGKMKVNRYQLAPLGRLLLNQINLIE
jgi:hypothetical protein